MLSVVMLNAIKVNVVKLSVAMLNAVKLSDVILNVVILNVVNLSVLMLSVLAPFPFVTEVSDKYSVNPSRVPCISNYKVYQKQTLQLTNQHHW